MRHVIFILFYPNEQRGGWGGGATRLSLFLFSFPCSADHERAGLATVRTHLDLLSIPRLWGGEMSKRLGGIKGCK